MPSTMPGASQLFKSPLTMADNLVKAAKDHVQRGQRRPKGYMQGQTWSWNGFGWHQVEATESQHLRNVATFCKFEC